jgi:hypothetical protein
MFVRRHFKILVTTHWNILVILTAPTIHIHIYYILPFLTENGSPDFFLNPFTVCSSYKRKFVICPFVDEETNGSYLFANGLNGLAHICL